MKGARKSAGPRALAGAALAFLIAGALTAQTPDLSGTWKLDESTSRIDESVTYEGLSGNAGRPTTLYVTQAKNGVVLIGSDANTSHTRTYDPATTTSAPLGSGSAEMKTRWDGSTLVSEGRDSSSQSALRERLTMSDDGGSLSVEISVTTESGATATTLVYQRATHEPPCQQWSTPCKDWSAMESPPSDG